MVSPPVPSLIHGGIHGPGSDSPVSDDGGHSDKVAGTESQYFEASPSRAGIYRPDSAGAAGRVGLVPPRTAAASTPTSAPVADDDNDEDFQDAADYYFAKEAQQQPQQYGNEPEPNMDMDSDYDSSEDVEIVSGPRTVIKLENVHKTYLLGIEGVPALRGVSLDIKAGEFIIILGTSGCGKTTMLNLMGTIDKPTKGYVTIGESRIGQKTTDAELAAVRLSKLGFVFQTFNLLSNLTALENVMLPMVLKGVPKSTRKKRAEDLLRRMGLGERMNHYPGMLSGGEQQRVTIARAVGNSPEVLLLDEPTGDLDTVNSQIVMRLLMELNEEEGITLVMVTHDVHLKDFADRVIRMRDGKMQSVQDIPAHARNRARRELDEFIRAHTAQGDLGQAVETQVEYREVTDYGPLAFQKEQEAKRLAAKQEARLLRRQRRQDKGKGPALQAPVRSRSSLDRPVLPSIRDLDGKDGRGVGHDDDGGGASPIPGQVHHRSGDTGIYQSTRHELLERIPPIHDPSKSPSPV